MSSENHSLTRRQFLSDSAALAAGAAVAASLTPSASAAEPSAGNSYVANWATSPDRVWLGPDFWSNPLQDWRVANGRAECTNPAADRNVHVLVRSLRASPGNFAVNVSVRRVGGTPLGSGQGSFGFRIGVQGALPDYRHVLIYGRGIDAGITANGGVFIGAASEAKPGTIKLDLTEVELRLSGVSASDGCALTLTVLDSQGRQLGAVAKTMPNDRCAGGVALVNNFGAAVVGGGAGKAGKAAGAKKAAAAASPFGFGTFSFADWRIAGSKVDSHPERAFGPILFSQYTLSGGTMKMSAQLPPLGAGDTQNVQLQLKSGTDWKTVGDSPIHAEARTAAFRIPNWDATKDIPYRLAYKLRARDGRSEDHFWTGMVRRDPVDKETISVADISCNIQTAFPNAPHVANVAKVNPDLIAFTGDQFYESSGGYGIIRTPTDQAMIDYLRKWYLHGWTWRELMRDRPSISLPDDHDVYQGNLWGEGGRLNPRGQESQESGGYTMPASWVNVVYRTQTAHHPDAYDPSRRDDVMQYYGPLTYGRISFALLADRQYKSGPEGKVPPTGGRGDHVKDPQFDPRTADIAGLDLLGPKQEEFLKKWIRDWRGVEMKAVISQTIFASFPTTHGAEREILRADYDSNGWPQTPRHRAVREMRKAFAFHIAGDQHIPGVIHYGVDSHRDAGVAFAGPPSNCGYTRWFEPDKAPWSKPKQSGTTGDFTDSFGNPMSVLAVRNGAVSPQPGDLLQFLEEKSSGLGVVHFDKRRRKIRIDCWPLRVDPTQPGTQWPGWPVEIDLLDNYARRSTGHLPPLVITGVTQPLIEVFEAGSGELVYALRPTEPRFRPHVFAAGKYTVRVSDPESGKSSEVRNLEPQVQPQGPITVAV